MSVLSKWRRLSNVRHNNSLCFGACDSFRGLCAVFRMKMRLGVCFRQSVLDCEQVLVMEFGKYCLGRSPGMVSAARCAYLRR